MIFDIKRAITSFLQVFLLGWILVCSLFYWLAIRQTHFENLPYSSFFNYVVFSPVSMFIPFILAVFVGVSIGLVGNSETCDLNNPQELKKHLENQKLSNQPLGFKVFLGVVIALILILPFLPDSEISDSDYKWITEELTENPPEALVILHQEIMKDGVITKSEFRKFMNLSFIVRLEQANNQERRQR